jgi:predicted Zn-dependent protease
MPYNRGHKTEADVLGLDLIAKAGFDPRESISLWRNMAAASGSGPPESLSTHPSPTTRIDELGGQMPKAMPLYNLARQQGKKPDCRR